MKRLNLSIEDNQFATLSRLANELHLNEGTVAKSLLAQAIDQVARRESPADISRLLYSIPGFEERLALAEEQYARGEAVPLDQL